MSLKTFWKGKKVLVTGYEGFLGSHLTRRLIGLGARVTGLDIRTRRAPTILDREDTRKMKVVRGDVARLKVVRRLIEEGRMEFVFHLAAEALVGTCLRRPVRAFDANIKGTWNVLEAARSCPGVRALVMASSDKAYGRHKELPYTEKAPLKGDHPYDVSKSCADLLATAYFHTYGVPVAVTRCGNIYGPGDFNFSRIVPDAIRSAVRGRTLMIRSDGRFTRDYVHVADIVEGYLLLAERLPSRKLAGASFNFSDENPLSVLEIVKKIYRLSGAEPRIKILNSAPYEIRHQYLSSRKARRILGWKPKVSLDAGLKETIAWYREYLRKGIKAVR